MARWCGWVGSLLVLCHCGGATNDEVSPAPLTSAGSVDVVVEQEPAPQSQEPEEASATPDPEEVATAPEPEEPPWVQTDVACEDASDCALCSFDRVFETPDQCDCWECPSGIAASAECARRSQSHREVCGGMEDRCPSYSCLPYPELACREGHCAVREARH